MEQTLKTMKQAPVISVVMPVYNALDYVNRAIDSVLNQTFDNLELIIIDDGSDDDTIQAIIAIPDDRIILHRNRHDFISSLNLGLDRARGKYIARMDSDDIMLPERLQLQFDFMEKYPDIDICGTWAECFGSFDQTMRTLTTHPEIARGLLSQNAMIHPSVIMRKSSLRGHQLKYDPDYLYAEDYKLWIDCISHGCKFANIPNVCLRYYCGESQVTSKFRPQMNAAMKRAQQVYIEYVMAMVSSYNDDAAVFIEKLYTLTIAKIIPINHFISILSMIYYDCMLTSKANC